MKITHQFRAFLESFHYLILPQIGKIETVSTEVNSLTGEIEKRTLRFITDNNINSDIEFINFISNNLHLNSNIIISDLNCFCISLKELLIQGFEAEIPGVGFLHQDAKKEIKFSGKSIYHQTSQKHKKNTSVIFHSGFWF
jgi:hypothetical protein